jgi:hypothetical protein
MAAMTYTSVPPSAARLTESLRDIGYDFPTAVADIVDNSIAAGARTVEIRIEFAGEKSWVSIADDGEGMTPAMVMEALRFGSRREYGPGDLGRYGLGLKTASLSQCRQVTIVTCRRGAEKATARTLDLDIIADYDDWMILTPTPDPQLAKAKDMVRGSGGTVVLWRNLDRVLPEKRPEGGWARRRLEALAAKTAEHLGIVFHRFLEGTLGDGLTITVNDQKVRPWNPFAPDEEYRTELPAQRFEITLGDSSGTVWLRRYVLPPREKFSSPAEFERMSGPLNWNRQQGIYVYRAGRLVQWGGWFGIRGIDEHTKLARAALEFDSDLDLLFNINVAKMRVSMPPQLRQLLEKPIHELCISADDAYRRHGREEQREPQRPKAEQLELSLSRPAAEESSAGPTPTAGLALRAAAMQAGEYDAWRRIVKQLQAQAPDIAKALGLDD